MKKQIAFVLVLVLALSAVGCGRQVQAGDVAGKSYVYEKEGFGGDFPITIGEDGSFQYYEGLLSSYIGNGTWQLDEDVLILTEDAQAGRDAVNRFKVRGGALVFQEENSGNFLYVKVADGERFAETDAPGPDRP